MADRPILFSGAMVRAILEGRKTVTRRVIKGIALDWLAPGMFTPEYTAAPENGLCPYGQAGDRLWVRETTEADDDMSDSVTLARFRADGASVLLRGCADPDFNGSVPHWPAKRRSLPSIHMPKSWARLWLEVTAVRVERLQDISEGQAMAEGIDGEALFRAQGYAPLAFERLWESINGSGSWDDNPWVWVVEFKRVEQEVPGHG